LMILLRQKDQVGLNWILDFNSSNIFHGFEFGQTKVGSPRISPQRWLLDDEVNKSWKPVQFSDVLGEHGDCSTSSCNSYRILVAVALFFFQAGNVGLPHLDFCADVNHSCLWWSPIHFLYLIVRKWFTFPFLSIFHEFLIVPQIFRLFGSIWRKHLL
jgi:hypothetical protein